MKKIKRWGVWNGFELHTVHVNKTSAEIDAGRYGYPVKVIACTVTYSVPRSPTKSAKRPKLQSN